MKPAVIQALTGTFEGDAQQAEDEVAGAPARHWTSVT